MGAVAGELDGVAFDDPAGKAEDGHIGAAGGAVDGEVAADGDIQAVEVVVGVGHGFGAFFGGGVGGEGVVGVGVFAVGEGVVFAVEGGGGGEDEFGDVVADGEVEEVEGAGGVGGEVDPGVLDGDGDAGSGGKVDDAYCIKT